MISSFFSQIVSWFQSQTATPPKTIAAPSITGQEDNLAALRTKVRDDVANLLKYGVKKPGIDIPRDFLQRTVPLLYRRADELGEADHVQLWNAYNQLSQWLKPATAESIAVADELNDPRNHHVGRDLTILLWLVIVIVCFVFGVQLYSTLIDNSLADYRKLYADYERVVDEEKVASQILEKNNPPPTGNAGQPSSHKTADDVEPLRSIRARKNNLEDELLLSAKTQCKLQYIEFPFWLRDIKLSLAGARSFCDNPDEWMKTAWPDGKPRNCPQGCNLGIVKEVANSGQALHVVFNSLVSPLLLGFLGAAAFLTRSTLNQVAESSFTRSWRGRMPMRLLLGGLLGVLGPQLYSAGRMEGIGLGLSLFAFLLGYSVDLAFSLFDRLIATIQKAFKPDTDNLVITPGSATRTATRAAGIAHPARPKLAEIRRRLREIDTLGPILETVLPPELFEQGVRPQVEAARALLAKLGPELDAADIDTAVLDKAVADAGAECANFTGENHPLAVVLGGALQSFDAVVGGSAADVALSLLTGSIAAAGVQDTGVYERWMGYLLAQPFNSRQVPARLPTPAQALECLGGAAMFQRVFGAASETLATNLLNLALSGQSTAQLAGDLWEANSLEGFNGNLRELFASEDELEEGWAEYRLNLVRYLLQHQDFPDDVFPGSETSPLGVGDTLAMVATLRDNPASARDLDILVQLAAELLRFSRDNPDLNIVELFRRLMRDAEARRAGAAPEGDA